jgi:hypothetical protein
MSAAGDAWHRDSDTRSSSSFTPCEPAKDSRGLEFNAEAAVLFQRAVARCGWSSRAAAVGRRAASLLLQVATKSAASVEWPPWGSMGTGSPSEATLYMAAIGLNDAVFRRRAREQQAYARHPTLQISALRPYDSPRTTSGRHVERRADEGVEHRRHARNTRTQHLARAVVGDVHRPSGDTRRRLSNRACSKTTIAADS